MTRAITLAAAQSRHDNWLPRDEAEPSAEHWAQAEDELPFTATQDEISARAWELMDEEIDSAFDAEQDYRASRYEDQLGECA